MTPQARPVGTAPRDVTSLQQFCTRLRESGLMDGDAIRQLWESFGSQPPRDASQLSAELIRRKKLTPYQAECLQAGKLQALKIDQYTILDHIADGGMGQVFLARHDRMQRTVALKIISEKFLGSAEALERFEQEVRAAAQLSHPNIVAAYDAGEQAGTHYLVMEYVDGPSLATMVGREGKLPISLALNYILQAAEGLQYSHRKGIVHRDIKPSNLLVDSSGAVKILDMGLALGGQQVNSVPGAPNTRLTQHGQLMGTSAFMAPEQALDVRQADARSDIYSLGCTLFDLLAGRPPYSGPTDMAVIVAHREQPIPSLCKEVPGTPATVDAIFKKMVAKRPDDRFASMDEVLSFLRACATEAGAVANPAPARKAENFPAVASPADAETFRIIAQKEDTVVSRQQKKKSGVLGNWGWMVAAAILLLTAAGGALGVILSLQTPHGILVVESADPDVKIAVKQGGNLVEIIDSKDDWKVSLKEGKYELELTGGEDELHLDRNTVVVRSKKAERLKVTLNPQVAAKDPPKQVDPAVTVPAVPAVAPSPTNPPPAATVLPLISQPVAAAAAPKVPVLRMVHELVGRRDEPAGIAFSPDGKVLASCGRNGHVVMWDTSTGEFLRQVQAPFEGWTLAFSPDGKILAVTGGRLGAMLIESETGKPIHTLSQLSVEEEQAILAKTALYPSILCVAFSSDGKQLVTGDNLNDLYVWDVLTGKQLSKKSSHKSAINGITFAPNGRRFVTASHDGTSRIWSAESQESLHTLRHERESNVYDALFTPDSATLYTCGNEREIVAWDPETGVETAAWKGHGGTIVSISLSADRKRLVSVCPDDHSVRFWDVATGQTVSVLRNSPFQPWQVRCSPTDSTLMAFASDQAAIRLMRYAGEEAGESGNLRTQADGTVVVYQDIAEDHLLMPPWQSFKSPIQGTLAHVELQPSLEDDAKVELVVYEGLGCKGKKIYSEPHAIKRGASGGEWRMFNLMTPLSVESGQTYTVELVGAEGMFHSTQDSYPEGQAVATTRDMAFRLYFRPSIPK